MVQTILGGTRSNQRIISNCKILPAYLARYGRLACRLRRAIEVLENLISDLRMCPRS